VPLGAAEEAVPEIAVRRPREPEVRVPESEIRRCMDDPNRDCLGWKVGLTGLEPFERGDPDGG